MGNKRNTKLFIGFNDTTTQRIFMGGNILVFCGLVYILYTFTEPLKEGITNMGCCGGVRVLKSRKNLCVYSLFALLPCSPLHPLTPAPVPTA